MLKMNKGILSLFILYIAVSINVPARLYLGLPSFFTIKQIALAVGILITLPYLKIKIVDQINLFFDSIKYLAIFFFISLFSFIIINIVRGNFDGGYCIQLLTGGVNILWLLTTGNVLSQGLAEHEKLLLLKGLIIIGLITLVSGAYEGISHVPLMSGGIANRGLGPFFWVRGFHVDKIDFVACLTPGAFSAFVLLINKKNWYLVIYLLISIYCIYLSFSFTGALGVLGGLLFITILTGKIQNKFYSSLLLIVCAAAIFGLSLTPKVEGFITNYKDKYTQITERTETKARYQMARICVEAFLESPLWGNGAGSSRELIWRDYAVPYIKAIGLKSAHSIMSVFADLGLLGGIPFIVFWVYLYAGLFLITRKRVWDELSTATRMLIKVSIGMSFIVFFRLIFYYHSMANFSFIIWPAIVYASLNTKEQCQKLR